MSKTTLTVFLCSTYSDLSAERDAVLQAVRKLQLQHDSMEFFGARTAQPIETCLEEVRRSDVLVVIVAYKYGNLVPDKTISFTEAEYSEGYSLDKPCLVYLRDENVPILPMHMERDPQKLQALERFKELLKARHTVATFKDASDLAVSVAANLSRTVQAIEEASRTKEPQFKLAPSAPELRSFITPASDRTPDNPCGEIPSSMKVAFVGSMVTKFSSELKSFSLIRIANEDVLVVEYNAPNAIVINATIRDESNNIIATIKKNVFHSYVPHGYQATSPDPHTVLVLDANDQVILYVRYLNPQAIKVLGVFRQPPRPPVRVEEGRFFVGPRECALTVCAEGGGTDKDWWQMKAALVVE